MKLQTFTRTLVLLIAIPCVIAVNCKSQLLFGGRELRICRDCCRRRRTATPRRSSVLAWRMKVVWECRAITRNLRSGTRRPHTRGYPAAQNNLGNLYSRGLGLPQSDTEALRWYMRAAAEGQLTAENNLGFMFATGRGVQQSNETAIFWFRKAAARGYAGAETNLGFMYSTGRGVPLDTKEAMVWYRKALKGGFAPAEFEIGQMYSTEPACRKTSPRQSSGFAKLPIMD